MSVDEQVIQMVDPAAEKIEIKSTASSTLATESSEQDKNKENDPMVAEHERSEKLLQAKELYSHGSRNYLIKNYAEAADELSRVCALYADLYGDISDELGMPYLLYAKSLIALSLDENKVIDVPDEANDDDDDDDDEVDDDGNDPDDVAANDNAEKISNGKVPHTSSQSEAVSVNADQNGIKYTLKMSHDDEADSTVQEKVKKLVIQKKPEAKESEVSSTNDTKGDDVDMELKKSENGSSPTTKTTTNPTATAKVDDEKPSTSNGISKDEDVNREDDDNEAASNLQLAWEILETAAKIFIGQGTNGLANLAEVQTELGNIQFENCILTAAREDYEKALKIYKELECQNYRRAMAEIHYKIGLSYLMEQLNKEGAASLKEACQLIQGEIQDIKEKKDLSDKDNNNIQDMEETKQEIEAKIAEIEEMQAQQIADVRAALDSYIKPIISKSADTAVSSVGPSSSSTADATIVANAFSSSSSSSSAAATTSKPNDITHLIKRKKPEDANSEAEAATSPPAKRPVL